MPDEDSQNTAFLNDCLTLASQDGLWLSSQEASLKLIAELIQKHFHTARVTIWQLDNQLQSAHLLYGIDHNTRIEAALLPRAAYVNNHAATHNQQTISISDTNNNPRIQSICDNYLKPNNICSLLYSKVIHNNEAIAVISVESKTPLEWTIRHKTWLQKISALLAPSIIVHHAQNQAQGLLGVINAMPVAVARAPMFHDQPFEYVSDSIINLCGYSAKELLAGQPLWQNLIFSEDLEEGKSTLSAPQSKLINKPQTVEYRLRHKDGSIRWINSTSNFYPNLLQNGQWALHALLWDITEEKQQVEAHTLHIKYVEEQNERLTAFNLLMHYLAEAKDLTALFSFFDEDAITMSSHVAFYPLGLPEVFANKRNDWDQWQAWPIAQKIHHYAMARLDENIIQQELNSAVLTSILTTEELTELETRGFHHCQLMPIENATSHYGIFQIWVNKSYGLSASNLKYREAFSQLLARGITNVLHTERLEFLANHDGLTLLKNRHAALDQLDATIAQHTAFALLILDLDGFKEINDTMGHHTGDLLLQCVAEQLTQICQTQARHAFRLGGDEFALIIASENHDVIEVFADTACTMINQAFELGTGFSVRIAGSIGISQFPKDASNSNDLMRLADIAMYNAKETGNACQFYLPEKNFGNLQHIRLAGELPAAIESGQLTLYFQPIIDTHTKKTHAIEGLIRWHHPEFGTLVPADFLAVAETSGHFNALTLKLLDGAIALQRQLAQQGFELEVSVNISPRNLQNHQAFELLLAQIKCYQLQPNQLCLEITETVLLKDIQRMSDYLAQLTEAGVTIAIDDFGVGFSSFAYIKTLPIHQLKIDQSFIADMLRDPQSHIIVETAINMAKQLGLKTTSEGIEDQATLEEINRLGGSHGQGFLIAKPIHPDNVLTWLQDYDVSAP